MSSWAENNRENIGSTVLEQWQNENERSLSKMYLVLTKQKCNRIESSAGFVITFSFHLLSSEFP